MNNLMKLTMTILLTSAFGLVGCTTAQKDQSAYQGRVIEFESDGNGFNTKTFFYEGKNEVVAFDAQFTEAHAKQAIQHLRTFTKKPISWLVVTHPNPDKFNGANVFQKEGAKVIASRATSENLRGVHEYKKYYFVHMAKMFTEETYPAEAKIDETFESELSLRLSGGETIELKELNQPGISLNQTIAVLPANKGIVVGDLVHHQSHAWLEGGIENSQASPTIDSWIEVLEKLKANYPSDNQVFGGRGEVAGLEKAISAQISYLEKTDELVEKYVLDLGDKSDELKGNEASKHYRAIKQLMEVEFPEYKLSYMIEYGVYGLVNSKL